MPAHADDDALAPYRDRFRLGMEKYRAGALGEAIHLWNAIYEEIGSKRGYRLAFNLGRAYDTNGEATRAVERYRSFLDEARARLATGEVLEPLVLHEVEDAEARIKELDATHGRIEVGTGEDAILAQVDEADPRLGAFTAYVAPGKHVVTFGPGRGDAEKVEVTVAAGETVAAHATHPLRPRDPTTLPAVDPMNTRRVLKHPFSPVVLYAGGVVSVASVVAPIIGYTYAYSLYEQYLSNAPYATKNAAAAAYPGAKTLAYGLLAVPIGLGAVTGGLVTWYVAGAEERTVVVSFDAGPTPGGAGATLRGSF